MDDSLIMSERHDSSSCEMDVKGIIRCRACSLSGEIFESGNVSINEVGYGNLTFQEMFETSIGYQIMPNEPQYFCQNCAQNLIQWYEFKEVCKETQTMFPSTLTIPSNGLEEGEIHQETVWFNSDNQNSDINIKSEDDTGMQVENYTFLAEPVFFQNSLAKTVTFKIYIKKYSLYPLKLCSCIGNITVTWTCESELYHQIWKRVKGHLKRKIIFVDNGLKPVWDKNLPTESDLNDFVQVSDPVGKKLISFNKLCKISKKHLKKWETKYPSLYINPYSNNVSSKSLLSIAEAVLLKNDQDLAEKLIQNEIEKLKTLETIKNLKCNELKQKKPLCHLTSPEVLEIKDCSMPENTSSYKYAITFKTFNRQFKNQSMKKLFIGNFTIGANDLVEFKYNLYKIVTPFIDREIVFDSNEEATWATKDHPTEDQLEKFVEFTDKKWRRRYFLQNITSTLLDTWQSFNDKRLLMYIFPFSSNIINGNFWIKAKNLIERPVQMDTDSENIDLQGKPVNESDDAELTLSCLTEKLKTYQKDSFPLATDRDWEIWAHYINSYDKIYHEKLLNEQPPTHLLPFLEKYLEIVENPCWTKPYSPMISFSAFIRLKEGVKLKKMILLGEYEFMGDTIEEIKHLIWKNARPYLFREIIFKDGIPEWSSKVTPTEEDLSKFVYIKNHRGKKTIKLDSLTSKSIFASWESKKGISLDIFPFSDSILTFENFMLVKSVLFDTNSKAFNETMRIVRNLKNFHERQIVSLDLNWKMWAYFIQSHEMSEQESLIKEKPPTELSHLFGSVDIQNNLTNRLEMLRKSNDKSDGEEEEERDPNVDGFDVDKLLQLTEEEKKNPHSTMKQCPFENCSSILVIIKLKKHIFECKFNPHLTLRYKCRYEGCNKAYYYKHRLKKHLPSCRFNKNKIQAPLRQCPYCPATTVSLNSHILINHSQNQYICDVCGVVKSDKGSIKSHILRVHQNVKIFCTKCPFEFKTIKSLKNHMLREHSDAPPELKFKCNDCSYKTYNQANLNRHIKFNHDPNGKKFVCPDCGKAFGTITYLNKHSLTHNQVKKFTCDVCSHVCTTANALKCHKTLHEEWKYECPVCGLKRRSAYEVRMHCGRKHPDYKLPPKGTIMKLTSKYHGKRSNYYFDDEETQETN